MGKVCPQEDCQTFFLPKAFLSFSPSKAELYSYSYGGSTYTSAVLHVIVLAAKGRGRIGEDLASLISSADWGIWNCKSWGGGYKEDEKRDRVGEEGGEDASGIRLRRCFHPHPPLSFCARSLGRKFSGLHVNEIRWLLFRVPLSPSSCAIWETQRGRRLSLSLSLPSRSRRHRPTLAPPRKWKVQHLLPSTVLLLSDLHPLWPGLGPPYRVLLLLVLYPAHGH